MHIAKNQNIEQILRELGFDTFSQRAGYFVYANIDLDVKLRFDWKH